MDVLPDTSLVRVTIYISGRNTLISSCQRSMMETCALEELRSRFWRPASSRISGNPGASCSHMECATLNKEKMCYVNSVELTNGVEVRSHLAQAVSAQVSLSEHLL